jgi:hypothetical protein
LIKRNRVERREQELLLNALPPSSPILGGGSGTEADEWGAGAPPGKKKLAIQIQIRARLIVEALAAVEIRGTYSTYLEI